MNLPFSRRTQFVLLGIVVIVVLLVASLGLSYNTLVSKDQNVSAQWAQVENQIQRKFDLIPQLVTISKDYQQFEKTLLQNLTALRSAWTNHSGIPQGMNLSNLASLFLANWVSVVENNPDLKSIQVIEDLFFEVTGTENRIAFERLRYNDGVRDFNTAVLSFPSNIAAGLFGFQQRPYFDPIPGGP